jgi:chromosome segregation ATPase
MYVVTGTLQALPCANPLQKMVSDIQPSFTEGLTHLENLFDMVMNYDENDEDKTEQPIVYAPMQRAIRWTFDSMSDSELLTQKHLKRYEAKVLALAKDIADKEKRIVREKIELEKLKIERSEKQKQKNIILGEVAHIEAKLRESDERARRAQEEISRRILGTIFTGGNTIRHTIFSLFPNIKRIIMYLYRTVTSWSYFQRN